jgi:hypothetical protein
MAGPDFARIAGAALLAVTLLLGSSFARADTSGSAAAPSSNIDMVAADSTPPPETDLPTPRTLVRELSTYRIAAIALGTVAGTLIGNILTGGLMTPLLTAGLAGPGTAAATSSAYAVGAVTTVFFAGIGAYVGVWASEPPSPGPEGQ